jgi:hypothetical protein
MNNRQRLSSVLVLTLVLGLSVFAGHASACDPLDPGHLGTPCVPITDQSVEPEGTGSIAANDGSDLAISEITFSLFETALSLF